MAHPEHTAEHTSTAAAHRNSATLNHTLQSWPRRLEQVPAAWWLALLGALMTVLLYVGSARRYSLDEFGTKPLQNLGTLTRLSADSLALYVGMIALLFGLYWLGLRFVHHLVPVRNRWLLGLLLFGGLALNVALLPQYPYDALDVYDYAIRGRMTAYYGLNPLIHTPDQVKDDPFYKFAAWRNVSSAYGPAWEAVAASVVRLGGDDINHTVVLFKLIAIGGGLLTTLLIGLILRRIAPRRTLLGMYLFWWNPFVALMTGGGAHNDTLMIACMVCGIYCLVRHWYAAGIVAALLGALIKFIPLALLPIVAIMAWKHWAGRQRLRFVIAAFVSSALLSLLVAAPYWTGNLDDILNLNRRSRLFTGSMATLVRQTLIPVLDGKASDVSGSQSPVTNTLLSRTAFGLLALYGVWQLWRLWQDTSPTSLDAIRTLTRILLFYLLVSAFWFQSWYVVWVVALAALLDNSPMRRFILLFSYLVTWQMVLYQFVTLRTGAWAPLPWRDLVPVASVMGVAWGWLAWLTLRQWWRAAHRNPANLQAGRYIAIQRQQYGLSYEQLADEFGWRTDDLYAYEHGDQSIALDRARMLGQRLGFDACQLLPNIIHLREQGSVDR